MAWMLSRFSGDNLRYNGLVRQRSQHPLVFGLSDFQARGRILERRLATLEQATPGDEDDILQTSAELKRMAAEIYLHTAVYGASPPIPLIRQHVQQILRLVYALIEQDVFAGLVWPLFVAAVELDPNEDWEWVTEDERTEGVPHNARPFILYALDKMSTSIANMSRTRDVIQKVWSARESHDFSSSRNESNDWERFVAPFCGNMSLA